MHNVFRVLMRDLKRIAKAPASWVVILVLIILPSLYTWFNVVGFWNPYNNTGALKVCVVNEDAGAHNDLLGDLQLGDQIVDQLHENTQLGWEFTDYDDAMAKISSGEAYAARRWRRLRSSVSRTSTPLTATLPVMPPVIRKLSSLCA